MRFSSGVPLVGAVLAAMACATTARADLANDFSTNPIGGVGVTVQGPDAANVNSRFTYSSSDGTLTAHVDTAKPTIAMLFALGTSLHSTDSFSYQVRFKINSSGFFADPDGFAQIAFGLANATTTGSDRSGSLSTSGDTFDLLTTDYFPNVSPTFGGPSLQTTFVTSKTSSADNEFSNLVSAFGNETALDNAGEGPLLLDQFVTAKMVYSAATRTATLTMADQGGNLLPINAIGTGGAGGSDGDPATIQTTLPGGVDFSVDSFVIPEWTDSWAFGSSSVVADVVVDSFSVTTPEPASLGLLGAGVLLLMSRRRRR